MRCNTKYIVKYILNSTWLVYKRHNKCRTLKDAINVAHKAMCREKTNAKIIKSENDLIFTDVVILEHSR